MSLEVSRFQTVVKLTQSSEIASEVKVKLRNVRQQAPYVRAGAASTAVTALLIIVNAITMVKAYEQWEDRRRASQSANA